MKKYFLLLIFACSTFIVNAQWNQEKNPFMTKSLSGASIKNIKMQTTGGNITVSSVKLKYRNWGNILPFTIPEAV
ncbi:MAG TPA: hypothetical protein VMY77_02175 [Chitinophagaceae bacterium]|nr:hypothetical protein [Chitinophagaceae bacterium]